MPRLVLLSIACNIAEHFVCFLWSHSGYNKSLMKEPSKNPGHWSARGLFSHDTQHWWAQLNKPAWAAPCPSQSRALREEQRCWDLSFSPHAVLPFPFLPCAAPACQSWFRCPRQGTTKHAVNISWWLICDVYQLMLFSKGSCKPLGKYNRSITCGRRQLFHWEAELYLRNKQTSHGYLGVHYLHANLGWKWRTSTYNSPREIQTANQLTCCIGINHRKHWFCWRYTFLTFTTTKLIFKMQFCCTSAHPCFHWSASMWNYCDSRNFSDFPCLHVGEEAKALV